LEEQLEKVQLSQNQEILEHLANLETLLSKKGFYVPANSTATLQGNGGLAQGKKNVAAGKRGVAAKKIKKSQVNTGKKRKKY
jgi:hypothetical protein